MDRDPEWSVGRAGLWLRLGTREIVLEVLHQRFETGFVLGREGDLEGRECLGIGLDQHIRITDRILQFPTIETGKDKPVVTPRLYKSWCPVADQFPGGLPGLPGSFLTQGQRGG